VFFFFPSPLIFLWVLFSPLPASPKAKERKRVPQGFFESTFRKSFSPIRPFFLDVPYAFYWILTRTRIALPFAPIAPFISSPNPNFKAHTRPALKHFFGAPALSTPGAFPSQSPLMNTPPPPPASRSTVVEVDLGAFSTPPYAHAEEEASFVLLEGDIRGLVLDGPGFSLSFLRTPPFSPSPFLRHH